MVYLTGLKKRHTSVDVIEMRLSSISGWMFFTLALLRVGSQEHPLQVRFVEHPPLLRIALGSM